MAHVYALYSCRDGRVRYVGETYYDCRERFKKHLKDAELGNGRLYRWFHDEWREGYPIRCQLLQWCKEGEQKSLETEWMVKFPDLLNWRKYRWWFKDTRKSPDIAEIRKYCRSHIFNVHGYRGIHYSHDHDKFRVMVYNGWRASWLEGDELPGGSEAVWFLDSTAALNAREKHRQRVQAPWLPDLKY